MEKKKLSVRKRRGNLVQGEPAWVYEITGDNLSDSSVHIGELVEIYGGIDALSKATGVSKKHISKMKSVDTILEKLSDGSYVAVRKDAVRFKFNE